MVETLLLLPVGKTTKPVRKYNGNNAFGVLGISPQSSMREVKHIYYELAARYHPDKNHSLEAKEQFKKINDAYNFIVKGGDIARYLALCNIAQSKQKLTEALRMIKMTKILTGVDLEEPRPNSNNDRGFMSDEEWEQQQRLLIGLTMRCPYCKYKGGCDIATGFGEVEDVYQRIVEKAMKQMVSNTTKRVVPESPIGKVKRLFYKRGEVTR